MQSPNPVEVAFLNAPDKKHEYLERIQRSGLRIPEENAVILDVGGNVGHFALQGAQLAPRGRVFSFEPFTALHASLTQNTSSSPNVTALRLAIGETPGSVSATYLPNYTLLSGLHVSEQDQRALEALAGRSLDHEFTKVTEEIQVVRLDDWMASNGIEKVDILKIDVEKAELGALRSVGARLKDVRCVAAEVHEENLKEFVSILRQRFGDKVEVSEKDLPKFTLRGADVKDWPAALNTYIIFARE
jgi:FkbM family methyltransferase